MQPRPSTLIAELSYQCPLHCPYCSNPLDIGGEKYRRELETEHWIRTFREARALGVLQLALTGGEPMLRPDLDTEPERRGQRPHRGKQIVREEGRGRGLREGARLPADDQLRPAPAEPRSDRGATRSRARSRRTAARACEHAVLRLGGRKPGGAHAVVGAASTRGGGGPAL